MWRLVRSYGTNCRKILKNIESKEGLGQDFGAGLTEREVQYLIENEWARTAEDIVWRRSKLGIRMTGEQIAALDSWITENAG